MGNKKWQGKGKTQIHIKWHAILYQCKERHNEWHIHCLENEAGGWGDTPEEAIEELRLTLVGQLKDTLSSGIDYFFPAVEPDPEWIEAYKTGKHPDPDIEIKGLLVFELRTKDPSEIEIEFISPLSNRIFQVQNV